MQITEQTARVLSLQIQRPPSWVEVIGALTVPAIFLGLGLVYILVTGKLTTLKCDRIEPTQVNCEITLSGLLGNQTTQIKQLQGAEVKERLDSDGDNHRVLLITQEGKIPITNLRTSRILREDSNIAKINTFIHNSAESSLKIQEDDRWIAYPVGIMLMLVGGGVLPLMIKLHKPLMSCVFDKDSGWVYLQYQNMFLQSESKQEKLDAIERVQIVETPGSDIDEIYDTQLILKSGATISLGLLSKPKEIVTVINHFLDIHTEPASD